MSNSLTGVGNYLTDSSSLVFIREQAIGIFASGMKPSTVVHVFFANKNVDAFVAPASFNFTAANPSVSSFNASGSQGATLTTDAYGNVAGIFYLPGATFYTGSSTILFADVASIASVSSAATTTASCVFQAFNYPLTSTDPSIVSPQPTQAPTNITTNLGTGTSISADTNSSRFDPLCQSFYISSNMTNGQDGLYVTAVDLYFQAKDPLLGVSFDIRSMENGIPTATILPYSRTHLTSSQVNADTGAATATTVTFPSPVYLRAGYEYVISIIPDGYSPNYIVWTTVVGGSDVITNLPVSKNWGDGVLFTSTTGSTWTPLQNEYLKFTLYQANFTANSGTLTFVNDDYEFFTVANLSSIYTCGEWAYQVTANSSGNVSFSTANGLVTGTGTTFTALTVGQQIAVTNGSSSDVLKIASITNNTVLTTNNIPRFTSNTAKYQLAPIGKVYYIDTSRGQLYLSYSAANSTVYFTANSTVIGVKSNTSSQIVTIDNKNVDRFQPQVYSVSPQGTGVDLNIAGVNASYANMSAQTYNTSGTNYVLQDQEIIASKTNEIVNNSGNKSLTATFSLTGNTGTSPSIDTQSLSLVIYHNLINNTLGKESGRNGMARSKGISETVTLAPGNDSEAMTVYLDAYRPLGTNIALYAKVINSTDPDTFTSKDWTPLTLANNAAYSNPTNLGDIQSYTYTIQTAPPSYPTSGVLSVSNTSANVTGSNTTFTTDINPSSNTKLLKIWSDPTKTSYQIVKVSSITNNTFLILESNAAFTSNVAIYEYVTKPHEAFLNNQNSGMVRYYNSAGSIFDSYISFAIKTVLISNTSHIVPRVMDMRVIATSV